MGISVSKLSEYAEDPSEFMRRNGKPISIKASKYGIKKHDDTGGGVYILALLITLSVVVLILCF